MYVNLYGNSTAFQTLAMLQGSFLFNVIILPVLTSQQDLKLGQYVKLPPRATFAAQMAGSIIGSIFNYTSASQCLGSCVATSHPSLCVSDGHHREQQPRSLVGSCGHSCGKFTMLCCAIPYPSLPLSGAAGLYSSTTQRLWLWVRSVKNCEFTVLPRFPIADGLRG